MNDKLRSLAASAADELSAFLSDFEERRQAVPYVKQALERIGIDKRLFEAIPGEIHNSATASLEDVYTDMLDDVQTGLHSQPFNISRIEPIPALSGTSGTVTAAFLSEPESSWAVTDEGTGTLRLYHDELQRYEAKVHLASSVRAQLQRLSADSLEHFDLMESLFAEPADAVRTDITAGNAMRALLEGVKGRLIQKANLAQNRRTWQDMAQGLADPKDRARLCAEEAVWKQLHSDLSTMLKDRRPGGQRQLDPVAVRTALLEHLALILTLSHI